MRRTALLLLCLTIFTRAALAQPAPSGGEGDQTPGFHVAYLDVKNPVHQKMRNAFMEVRLLERIAESLNQKYTMPRPVTLVFAEMDTPNAFYHPEAHAIIITYELIDYFIALFAQIAPDAVADHTAGAIVFTLFHELGHCLIGELELPATGREEDAVDDFATLLLIEAGDSGEESIISASMWFMAKGESKASSTPFWDEHSLDMQRFYGIVTLVYGYKPARYEGLCKVLELPERRLALAREEYARKHKAWDRLLAPYRREP